MEEKEVVAAEEWLAKLRAALDHRTRLHVTARTDARAALGLDEAIERARMARDLGVDAVFVEAPQSLHELDAIAQALPGTTLVANMVETGKTPLLTPSELADRGFQLVVSPVSVLFSAVWAMQAALDRLASVGTLRDDLTRAVEFDAFTALVDLSAHEEARRRYL
jgi:methylisocitrate lyase